MFIFVYRNFEGGYFDVGEQLTSNIESCLRAETTGSGTGAVTTYTALNTQGELALSLCNKNEIHALIAPFSPTQSLDSLIPSGIDFSLRVQFNEGILNTYNYHINATLLKHSNPCFFFSAPRFFVTQSTTVTPKLHIKDARLYVQVCLLAPQSLIKIHQRLANGTLQLPYMANVVKTFSVEVGHLEAYFDLTLKDTFQSCIVLLYKNTELLGTLNSNILKWSPHNLKRAYLQTGLSIK